VFNPIDNPVFFLFQVAAIVLFWGGLGVGIFSKNPKRKTRGWITMGVGLLLWILVLTAAQGS
jgi:hypothetical protein